VSEHPNIEHARKGYDAFAKGDLATLAELIADDAVWHVKGVGPLDGDYHGRDQAFGFFGRLAEETGGASRNGKSIEVPVVNVSHNDADGRITEFWAATTDPQASLDFWA
jgi:ketosteroid isomerase-like protein